MPYPYPHRHSSRCSGKAQRRLHVGGTSLGAVILVSVLLRLHPACYLSFTGHGRTGLGLTGSRSGFASASARRLATAVAVPPAVREAEVNDSDSLAQAEIDLPPLSERPGTKDAESFHEGESVAFWREFVAENYDGVSASQISQDLDYWLYHLGRSGFFVSQSVASVVLSSAANGRVMVPKFLERSVEDPVQTIGRLRKYSMAVYTQDLDYIKKGYYKKPYDMQPRHRQFSPSYILDKSLRYFRESEKTLRRSVEKSSTDAWVQPNTNLYPDYYRHTFHYQSDGWLSSESAAVYETSTETLFGGTQDAMQRTTLVHMAKHIQNQGFPADGTGTKLLEIACGTGRFMTFVQDNYPGMDVTASDLSPFYLEEARKNNQYWEKEFAPKTRSGSASFLQANAEALPFEANSFDMVVSVYLFHELPAEAQDAVFAEVARVLAPGGMFVLTDSLQFGDRPKEDGVRSKFGDFAEPHYDNFLRRDFAQLARSHGLAPVAKEMLQATKSLSFLKPMESSESDTDKSAA